MGKLTTSQKYRMGFRDVFHKYRKSKMSEERQTTFRARDKKQNVLHFG